MAKIQISVKGQPDLVERELFQNLDYSVNFTGVCLDRMCINNTQDNINHIPCNIKLKCLHSFKIIETTGYASSSFIHAAYMAKRGNREIEVKIADEKMFYDSCSLPPEDGTSKYLIEITI